MGRGLRSRVRDGGRALVAAAAVLAMAGCTEAGAGAGEESDPTSSPGEERLSPEFDGDAAYALVERQVSFGPRVPGTDGHAAQLAWMRSYLAERADTVIDQAFTHTGPAGETLELTNLFARFRPEARDRVLFLAHWDTRPTADEETDPERRAQPIDGANDGASGTAVLLQLADVLSRHSPPIGVDLLLVDGEDYAPGHMYLGATHFAETLPQGYAPFYGILLDMVGDRTPEYPKEAYSRQYAPAVVDQVWRLAERMGYGDMFVPTDGRYITDDHLPLNDAGIPTIDIIDFDYGPANAYWHTLDDTIENVGPEGLGVVGDVLSELVFRGG